MVDFNKLLDKTPITSFSGMYSFLSNFHPATVEMDGVEYPSVEHAFQAAKFLPDSVWSTVQGKPLLWREKVRLSVTPGQAKKVGRGGPLREGWNDMRVEVMLELIRWKFGIHDDLQEKLLQTRDRELIEGNTWDDTFWGCVKVGERWVGENWLGILLMQIREELRS